MTFTKIRRFANGTAAVLRATGTYYVETWNTATDRRQVLDTINFEGPADERAARAMALGCLGSLTADNVVA